MQSKIILFDEPISALDPETIQEVLYQGYWYGLDPTNDSPVEESYIKIGVGREDSDCMINHGIIHG